MTNIIISPKDPKIATLSYGDSDLDPKTATLSDGDNDVL